MADDWLSQTDNMNIVGAVLLHFSIAFDVIDHDLQLEKKLQNIASVQMVSWMKSYFTN